MKNLSSFLERHEIDRPMFFTLLILCTCGMVALIHWLYTLIEWWSVAPIAVSIIWIVAMILKAHQAEKAKHVEKKWVADKRFKGF